MTGTDRPLLPAARGSRSRLVQRVALAGAGFCLALFQVHTALEAAGLPQVLTGVNARFEGAQLPVVTGNNMVINQFADKATLHWQSFNIGAENKVEFQQPSASAVALNRIFDAVPSQVNGQLTANGQVYLINQNGIVFGPDAQVNTQSLVASTLDIDDQVYQQIGFVNAINQPPDPLPATGPLPAFDSFGQPMGEIRVAEGAKLESAEGGRILLFAPTIVNEGTISTPEGQQVLAAAQDRVLIAASDDPNLRGLLVEVSTGGDVTNLGSLIAERGNVTLLGLAVNQEGVARATTSVSLNGSVRLLARDMDGTLALAQDLVPRKPEPVRGGEVHLRAGSVTEVVPDPTVDDEGAPILAVDAQAQPVSRIDIAGRRVQLETGSRVTATGGIIDLTAALNPGQPDLVLPGDPSQFDVELRVAGGAIVDASGDASTVVSVARNVVEVEARGNELADSPLQRDGPIRNETLQVDIRRGTQFLNIDGAVAAIGRTAAERQSVGGSVRLRSEGRIVLEEASRVDVSGGQVEYTDGFVSTSRLRQANGNVVDISNADPDQAYLGVVQNTVTREAGYVEGKDAGSLTLQARGLDLSGEIRAGSTAGANQRLQAGDLPAATPAFARPFDEAPRNAALALQLLGPELQELVVGARPAQSASPVAPFVLPSAQLADWGAGRIGLVNAGAVIVNGALELAPWSVLSLTGPQVSVVGDLRIPGGAVTLNATNVLVGEAVVPDEQQLARIDGKVDLSGIWVNDNPLLNRARPTTPLVRDGGNVTLNSGSAIEVSAASLIDVSAGAWRASDGRFSGGEGGSIAFATGSVDANLAFGSPLRLGGELRAFGFSGGGSLTIGTERIRIVPEAGAIDDNDLLLDANRQFALREVDSEAGNRQYVLEVGAGTFQMGGFASWDLTSTRSDLEVATGAAVPLRAAGYLLTGASPSLAQTGTALTSLATPVFAPDFERRPSALTLSANDDLANAIGAVADLRIAAGASIIADAGSAISLNSTTSLFVDGRIEAPAGSIDLNLSGGPGIFQPAQMIWLGTGAVLSAGGTALIDTLDPRGIRRGEVLDGGRIRVRADQGSIVGAPGANIVADGARATLDTGFGIPVRAEVASAAGEIELVAAESLLYQGGLSGAAPNGFAVPGGRLSVGIDPSRRGVSSLIGPDGIPRGPHKLVVGDFTGTLPDAGSPVDSQYYSTGFLPLTVLRSGGFDSLDLVVRSSATGTNDFGQPVPDTPDSLPVIDFPTDVDLRLDRSIDLNAAVLRTDAARVSIYAPYVSIGYGDTRVRLDGAIPDKTSADDPQEATASLRLTPVAGDGTLSVSGELIELRGELVTYGFGDAAAGRVGVTLTASGDLRARGVRKTLASDYSGLFRTAGNLTIDAARVYPTTLTEYQIGVEGVSGSVAIAGNGMSDPPLSAGGALTLIAADIVQGGSLFAPLGVLNLDAASTLRFTPGSLTSTSAAGVSAPFFRTEPGGALIVPAPGIGEDQIVFVEAINNPEFERLLPEKRIRLASPGVELQPGSRFELRGGSGINATEFVPGPGGSVDILLADLDPGPAVDANESFAILPGIGSYAPFDPLESPAAADVQGMRVGDTLVLEEGFAGLAAGEYAILPARYALFGGYLITPESGYQDLRTGQGLQRLDGAPILAGRFGVAGNDTASGRSQGFAIENGSSVRQRAEYLETPLDELYTQRILRAPRDAGSLAIEAGDRLDLRGELIRGDATGGLGSAVDIASAAALSVVRELTGAYGIELRALDLASLGADSLLLGGTRSPVDEGVRLDATASEVRVAAGVELDIPELLLVGDRIVVEAAPDAPTRLRSSRQSSGRQAAVVVAGDAAVLALSDQQLTLARDAGSGSGGSTLALAAEASFEAGGGLILDATGDVNAAGNLDVRDGTLNLGAARLSLGETDGQAIGSGLVLSNADLAAIAGSDLRLRSSGPVEIYGALTDQATSAPISFRALSIDAPAIRGLANGNLEATLVADTIELGNRAGVVLADPAQAAAPGSSLWLQARDRVELADGAVAIQGYSATSLDAGTTVSLTGDGSIAVDGALNLATPLITASRTTQSSIAATGRLTVTDAGAAAVAPAGDGLGATLTIRGADLSFGGRIALPSGTVRLVQQDPGDGMDAAALRVAPSAVIDVSGETLVFGPKQVGTPGGLIVLTAETGTLELAGGAVLDVAGATPDGEAGGISLRSPAGVLLLATDAALIGTGSSGGRFVLDAAGLTSSGTGSGNAMTNLSALLATGGFGESRSIRLRQQDIVVAAGSGMEARHIRLVSDTGSIDVAGSLNASGAEAGSIWLAAGDRLDLSGSLLARSGVDGASGGRVDLYALDADGDDPGGAAGDTVSLRAGSLVDVAGGAGASGGEVFIHARRLDTNADGITDQILLGDLSGQVAGASRAQLLATRVLRDPDALVIPDPISGEPVTTVNVTATQIEGWRSETEAFLLGLAAPTAGPLEIAAGLQVESSGDLVLQDRWNFMEGWYFGQDLFSDPAVPLPGVTGVATLRAARNVEFHADLTDAFAEQYLFGFLPFDGVVGAVPQLDAEGMPVQGPVRQSWGYRLTAGAELGSADVMAYGSGAATLLLDAGVRVRTGTADIDVAASGDVRLEDGAAIYSAGWDRGLSDQLQEVMAPITSSQGLTPYDLIGSFLNGGQFADGGGSVAIAAGGNLVGATVPGPVTAWLTRVGSGEITATTLYSVPEGFGAMPTHWGVAFNEFRNGVGAFGGGDLRIAVGGDIGNVALALPTTGRATDGVVADTSAGRLWFQPSQRSTEILGGGVLDVRAGGDVTGGQVILGRGAAILRNGGNAGGDVAPLLYVGADATVDWLAGGGMQLGGIADPTVVPLSDTQLTLMSQIFSTLDSIADIDNRFFTYTGGSTIRISALGGDVALDGPEFVGFLPPSLTAVAFRGDINVVPTALDFFPAATGTLELLARDNVIGNFAGSEETRVRQSDQDRSLLPGVDRPDIVAGPGVPAPVPVHTGDAVPNLIVALNGSVRSRPGAGFWTLELAKPALLQAGLDIDNLSVRVQHIAADSLTSFQAGRDIVQGALRDNTGRFRASDGRKYEIWGPGSAEFIAWRNISLGTSAGIESIGNARNAALADEGAALRLIAGTGAEPAFDRFIDVYLSTGASAYRDQVNAFLADVDAARAGFPASSEKKQLTIGAGEYAGSLNKFLADNGIEVIDGDAVATFRKLDRSVQRALLTDVLFAELKTWGSASETPDRADRLNYTRGFTALDTLFELDDPLGERSAGFAPGAIDSAIRTFLTITDPQAANDAQVQLFGDMFPQGPPQGDISLLLSQVQTLAGGSLSMLAPGGNVNAGAADADIIDKDAADLGIVTARGGDINLAVGNDLLVNSTRAFALQGDLLVWSSHGNIDAGKGAKTVTSVPDPITTVDAEGNVITQFPPAVSGSGLQGENAALFAPRGQVNAGDAGIRTSGDLTIGAVEIVGTDNIDVGGVEIGFSTTDVVAVAPPGASSASTAASKGMDSQAAMLSEEDELGERTILGTEVSFINVEVLSFGDSDCSSDDKDCRN